MIMMIKQGTPVLGHLHMVIFRLIDHWLYHASPTPHWEGKLQPVTVTRQRQLGDFALRMDSTTPHAKDVGETSIYENTLDYSIYSFHVCVYVYIYI